MHALLESRCSVDVSPGDGERWLRFQHLDGSIVDIFRGHLVDFLCVVHKVQRSKRG
jgi:hypothetical protein